MQNKEFLTLFGDYIGASAASLPSGEVLLCDLIIENRSLVLKVHFKGYVNLATIINIKTSIKNALELNNIELLVTYEPSSLCAEALADMTELIKAKNPAFNGYFNGAEFSLSDTGVTIALKYGGVESVNKLRFDEMLQNVIKQHFGREVAVTVTGEEKMDSAELPPPVAPVAHKPGAPQKMAEEKPKKVFTGKPSCDLPVYLESAELFYGRSIDNDILPLSEYIPLGSPEERRKFVGWGKVFDFESRAVNSRRGPSLSVKFCFSDNTNSLNASLFIDEKLKNQIAPLKDGASLLINGSYEYDRWLGEFVVKVTAMATLQTYEESDNAEEKRIELHCHTNMSAKDAVCNGGAVVNRAYKLGHRAVAITDHGVVQAYPAAAAAVKKIRKSGGDFKVIYGVEAYFVDDEKHDISKLGSKEIGKLRNHQILLVKNLTGLKNLYKLVSEAHLNDFHGKPCTLKSKLVKHREGLLVGSACEAGDLYRAIVNGASHEELIKIASFYDYL